MLSPSQLALNKRPSTAKRDPTRTATLRNEYARAGRTRFAKLKTLINTTIVTNDALMLSEQPTGRSLGIFGLQAQPGQKYTWPSDPAGKAQAFMDWLESVIDQEILEVTQREGRRIVSHVAWQNMYVRAAYGRGVEMASAALKRAGIDIPQYSLSVVFNSPMHADVLALMYARNFSALKGITEAMGSQISKTLAEGLGRGLGPREIARMINDRVDAIGINRATTLARTEIIHAHAESTLNRFEEFGIDGVMGQAEWSTSGDGLVCPRCAAVGGKIYSLSDARGMLPMHPNCRCAWLPVLSSQRR